MASQQNLGNIRVGRIKFDSGGRTIPEFKGYTSVMVMTKSSKYGSLGPYVLKDKQGRIMENIWQFAKVYKKVPKSVQRYSRWDSTVIWDHPPEVHVDEEGKLTEAYWNWREKGMNNKYPVRYPVGYHSRGKCLYAIISHNNNQQLDYIQARKKIYLPVYKKLVKKQPQFKELRKRLKEGENLLIIEVDGPHQESLPYYKQKYGVNDDFIQNDTILVTQDNMSIMLNDAKHAFGHGYCLAIALLKMNIDLSI